MRPSEGRMPQETAGSIEHQDLQLDAGIVEHCGGRLPSFRGDLVAKWETSGDRQLESLGNHVGAANAFPELSRRTRLDSHVSQRVEISCAALGMEIEHALRERLLRMRQLQKAPLEPKTAAEVPHSRERISAELGFVNFAESIRQTALGKGAEHHAD